MLPIKTILHATDFSETAHYAFRLACSLAGDYGARLIVLHVVAPPIVVYGSGIIPPDPRQSREEVQEALKQLCSRNPKVTVEHRLVEGDPAAVILHTAEDTNSDVIVLGTHGRGGLSRLLMGSVAGQVARKAACPVVTIRAPLPKKPGASHVEAGELAGAATE